MNISGSSNAYNALNSTNKGFSGMISGMDTEEMVKKMLSGQQNKIDKQMANKQVAQWKQTIYRDKITKINSFQKKFFDLDSSTNLTSSSFFNQMSSTTASKAFKITGSSSSAISGAMRMKIDQLATSTSLEGSGLGVTNPIQGTFNEDAFNSRVSFDYAMPSMGIDGNQLKDADGNLVFEPNSGKVTLTSDQIDQIMNSEEVEIKVPKDPANPDGDFYSINLKVRNSKLTIESKLKLTVSPAELENDATSPAGVSTTNLGLEKLGLSGGKTTDNSGKMTGNVKHDAAPTLDITFDGVKKTITLASDETIDTFKDKVKFAFGNDAQGITVVGTSMEDFELTTTTGRKIVIGGSSSGLALTGLKSGQSNIVGAGDTLESAFGVVGDAEGKFKITINDVEIELNKNDTISQMRSKISNSAADVDLKYSEFENKFVLSRKSSGAGFDITFGAGTDTEGFLGKLFGATVSDPDELLTEANGYSVGVNAIVEIDGITTERSSNNFTVGGISFELLEKNTESENIYTTRDTETVFAGIKSFVDDYNALIKELNDLIGEEADYKDYPPLTEAQRKDMSTSEIAAWEKKAQVGLLKGDSDISSFLSGMRMAIFQKPDSAKYAMYDIGIDTSDEMSKRGALKLDEAKLKEMINKDPAAIQELFTFSKTKEVTNSRGEREIVPDGVQGIASAFKYLIKSTANTSSGSPGKLVQTAGYANTGTDKNNTLFKQMQEASDRIKTLTFQYNRQKERYWKQFNNMENVLSNLTAQSSWLTQQTSGM